MTENELNELAAAYALGALVGEEKAGYEAWLALSADARAESAALAQTAAELGLAVMPIAPPPSLRASLLAQIAVTPQLAPLGVEQAGAEGSAAARPAVGAAAPVVPVGAPAEASPEIAAETSAGAVAETRAESRAQARWFRRPTTLIAAAAAAVLLFVGGNFVGISIANNNFAVTQATELAALQAAPDSQQAQAPVEGGGTATLIWSLEQRRSAVMIDELPALPAGQTYQLWYIGEGGAIPAGTFEAAAQGKTWRVLDGAMTGGDVVGVTVEPSGGSKAPTTDPILKIASA